MSYTYEDNPYYHPESHGFETIAELEFSNGDYQYDTIVVWYRKEDDSYWYAVDSGCSCPTPFEECSIELAKYDDIMNEIDRSYISNNNFEADKQHFIEKLRGRGLHKHAQTPGA